MGKKLKKIIKRKGQTSDDLSADDFFEHFSSIFQAHPTENNPENTQAGENADFILNNPITEEELKKVIMSLKNNKSPGIDGLISEIFKCSQGILSPIL